MPRNRQPVLHSSFEKCRLERLLVLCPAEFMQRSKGMGKGKPDNIEIAPFDARDVPAGAALNGIRPGLVIGFLGREIARNLIPAESSKRMSYSSTVRPSIIPKCYQGCY